ncbi:MAG: sigma 54-interacting transcriptional regulator [Merdibacter sp.]
MRHQPGILQKDARFIALNCSEYANNPELLTANLFGHVKGAYTGADSDQPGLIQLADKGVLFLDEVHCLKAECQEKLFQFMDKGIYHKVGDNENWYHSSCHLIFATTEDPQQALLGTMLRRIPITIFVPSLNERPRTEKIELITSMLQKESRHLQRELFISYLAYQTLMDHDYKGNIGELQNVIKATCANVLLHEDEEQLCIHLLDLPMPSSWQKLAADEILQPGTGGNDDPGPQSQPRTPGIFPSSHLYSHILRPSRTPAERKNRTIRSSPAVNSMYRTSSICCSLTRNTVSSVPTNHIC